MPSDFSISRRDFGKLAAALAALGELPAAAQPPEPITEETIAQAEKLAGLEFTPAERKQMLQQVRGNAARFEALRRLEIPNEVPPAARFNPELAPARVSSESGPLARGAQPSAWSDERPPNAKDLAFTPAWRLSRLVRERKVSPVELAELSLARLKTLGARLECVVTLLEAPALEQAAKAEREIALGYWRGPLHGLPWGVKDLFAAPGAPTTWGAEPYRDRIIERESTVVARLREAGAVLVAKLTTGALAMGDVWHGGQTKNPWNEKTGSSGSSAGPAAATAAGLVPFAIGTETLGSIVSPCSTCGVTGLRPTFGRVSRAGGMALSWSMDKPGPIARSAEDCALVFDAIHGADGIDPDAVDRAFAWNEAVRSLDLRALKIGYTKNDFDGQRNADDRALNEAFLEKLRELGAETVAVELPEFPTQALRVILEVEAAAQFDDFTRNNEDDQLRAQHGFAWPNQFRAARTIPAVEYVRAQRTRTLLMRAMSKTMEGLAALAAPARAGEPLTITNLTGHPAVALPHSFAGGMPRGMTLIGALHDDARLLALARAYQSATDWHERRPPIADH